MFPNIIIQKITLKRNLQHIVWFKIITDPKVLFFAYSPEKKKPCKLNIYRVLLV